MLLQRVITAVVLLIIIIGALLISLSLSRQWPRLPSDAAFGSGSGSVNGITESLWSAAFCWRPSSSF